MAPQRKAIKSHEISYIEDTGQVKFYLRRPVHLYVPTALKDDGYDPLLESSPPKEGLDLNWVYGYRGRDARNNVFVLGSGEVVYFTAGVAVVYNCDDHCQRYYTQHSDDIKSIAVHPDGETVATGQIKGRDDELDAAHIRVWNSTTMETLHVFGQEVVQRGVNCLAFSLADGGAHLAVVDDDTEPRLSVWEWADENKLAENKCSGDPVLAVTYSREDTPRIITSGKNSIMFWLQEGDSLKKRTGVFGKVSKPKYITCVAFAPDGSTITGDSNGNVLFWNKDGNDIARVVAKAHNGSVFSILASKDGGYFTSGKDLTIKQWDEDFATTDNKAELPEEMGCGRALAEAGGQLVLGTTKNAIIRGAIDDNFTIVTQGSEDDLWALAMHPSKGQFLTGSVDGRLTERTYEGKSIMWSADIGFGVQSVCYSPGGEVIVVGGIAGHWRVLAADTKEQICGEQEGEEPIQAIRFSPDGSLLALASRDNRVYVYATGDGCKGYTKRGVCSGHSSFIRCFDFSADGAFIRTNSGDYELLFWGTSDCDQIPDSADLRDVDWATGTCLLSFDNFGVWPQGVDGTDINAVNWSHSKQLCASADDFGKVKLFKAPIHFAYCANKVHAGHSSHVTAVEFSHDDSIVMSLGGNDCSILQWKINSP